MSPGLGISADQALATRAVFLLSAGIFCRMTGVIWLWDVNHVNTGSFFQIDVEHMRQIDGRQELEGDRASKQSVSVFRISHLGSQSGRIWRRFNIWFSLKRFCQKRANSQNQKQRKSKLGVAFGLRNLDTILEIRFYHPLLD
ncbi:hypothetical protein GALMADRAFT_215630 [Galerina marginata CBS 339.88]|uniref:Uncharacterized protein n=1 Tax=Galerina marginata (strain CBS 339.88) TaxID=685588 RepID=A0A067SPR6_GALM3|nr:hypothetical protein GALMADRAFT_215630 [Galerina marginata CBS 339.88]